MKKDKKKGKVTLGQVFKTIMWPRRKLLLVGLVLIVISRLAGLVLPGATKVLLDDIIPNKDFDYLKTVLIIVTISLAIQASTSYILTSALLSGGVELV